MANTKAHTIALWMYSGGLLSTHEARVTIGYHLKQLLCFFQASQPLACIPNSVVYAVVTIC